MTQEHETLLALAAARLLDPAHAGRQLAATVRCYIKDVRAAFRYENRGTVWSAVMRIS